MSATAKQLTLDLGHRPAHGREDFMVSPVNQDAVAWIDRWPGWPAPAHIIYGPAASGKTHLAAVWRTRTKAVAINPEELSEHNADALTQRGEHLVIDHVDPWIGDRKAETTLFHVYNILKEQNRTVLITMRMPPQHADFTIADLASRLRAAPATSIQPPDDSLLAALMVKLFTDRQLQISHDALNYILPRMERSFSAARDLVEKADHLALSEKKAISIPLLRRILMEESG